MIGLLLQIPIESLDKIGKDSQKKAEDALSDVFKVWSETQCSPYSWSTVLNVLASDPVGLKRLADDIAHRLSGKIGDCIFTSCLCQCGIKMYHRDNLAIA